MKFCFNEEILELPTFFRIWSFSLGLFASSAIPGFTLTQQATGQLGRENCNSLKTTPGPVQRTVLYIGIQNHENIE